MSMMSKVQLGIAVLILGVAGYVLFQGTKPPADGSISVWPEPVWIGKNPDLPVDPVKNPKNPALTGVMTVIACYDGRFSLTEFPKSLKRPMTIRFEPDRRHLANSSYQTPTDRITSSVSDPAKRLLTLAAYYTSMGNSRDYLKGAGLTPDQKAKELAARQVMKDEITLLDLGTQTKTSDQHPYNEVAAALKAYRAVDGDASKDQAKANAARLLIAESKKYLDAMEAERMKPITAYADTVYDLMTSDQRKTFADKSAKTIKSMRGKAG